MKIKLSNNMMFNPNKKSTITLLIINLILIFYVYINILSVLWCIIFIGIEILLYVWLETTYYPHGIKEEDMK